MSDLIQLVYASRARLSAPGRGSSVPLEIGRILVQSRHNNAMRGIGGVLCYGDGVFLQCLEGERDVVEALYRQIQEDRRHRGVSLLRKRMVPQRHFRIWAMKYLHLDPSLRQLLSELGYERFEPFGFDEDALDRVLAALRQSIETAVPEAERPDACLPRESTPIGYYALAAAVISATFMLVGWWMI
jgi:hypothetical protein